MKKLFFLFFFFTLATLIFSLIVFKSDIEPFALRQKTYLKKFKELNEIFDKKILKTEKSIYENFLNNPFNINVIEGITKGKITPKNSINFTKSDRLVNFAILDENRTVLYEIKPQKISWQFIDNFDSEKKFFTTERNTFFFKIPYEKNFKQINLIFEFSTRDFLNDSLSSIKSHNDSIISLPPLLVLNVDKKYNQTIPKKIIQSRLRNCIITKPLCNTYLPSLQKRLLIDTQNYLSFSVGFLYPSNPMDITKESIIVFIILLLSTTLIATLILFKSRYKKDASSKDTFDYQNPLAELTKKETFPSSIDEEKNQTSTTDTDWENQEVEDDKIAEEIERDIEKIDSSELPDLSDNEDETKSDAASSDLIDLSDNEDETEGDAASSDLIDLSDNEDEAEGDAASSDLLGLSDNESETESDATSGDLIDLSDNESETESDATSGDLIDLSDNESETESDATSGDLIDLSDNEDETEGDVVPEVGEETYSKVPEKALSPDQEITELHREINEPTKLENDEDNIKTNNQIDSLKKEYKNFSFEIIKKFFPKPNLKEAEKLLKEFPHAKSLLLLQKKGKSYSYEAALFSDSETIEKFRLPDDHYLITKFLNHKKGILIYKQKENLSLIKPWFSDSEFKKIESVFMFSLTIGKKNYIFTFY